MSANQVGPRPSGLRLDRTGAEPPVALLCIAGFLAVAGAFGVAALDPAAGVVLLVVFGGMYGVLRLVVRLLGRPPAP